MKEIMKTLFAVLTFLSVAAVSASSDANWRKGPSKQWFVNWDKALTEAKNTGKPLFVLNTGSDWCYWCKKLHGEVLNQPEFIKYAEENLVLVYLDSPRRNPLEKDQMRHNRTIAKALQFDRGVPHVVLMSPTGNKLGTIGGGALGLAAYMDKVRSQCSSKGSPLNSEDAEILFSKGYAALLEKFKARMAALPPAKKDDFKVSLSGMAIGSGIGVSGAESATFSPVDQIIDVPLTQPLIFRIEYDIPEGWAAQLFVQPLWDRAQQQNYRYFNGNNSSELYKGKGVAYSYMQRREPTAVGRLKSVAIRVLPEPEFDDFPYGWMGSRIPVNVGFQDQDGNVEAPKSEETEKKSYNDRKWQKGPDRMWFVNWEKALAEAKKTNKKLFVLNTGSDWCGWCKKLRADVLSSNKFRALARKHFVLVYIDGPRKNPLPAEQAQHNHEVESRLGFGGGVPCVKIIDSDGSTEISTISGYKPEKEYLSTLKTVVDDKK